MWPARPRGKMRRSASSGHDIRGHPRSAARRTSFHGQRVQEWTGGGVQNPSPIVVDARELDSEAMRRIAARHGHESAFVLPGRDGCDYHFRFFVPNHEMEMCGHAALGTIWLLDQLGQLPRSTVSIATLSGPVQARVSGGQASVSQPKGRGKKVEDSSACA